LARHRHRLAAEVRSLARIVADRLGPIPVILTSGCAEEASAAAVSIPDATALAKPFTLPQLTATLAAALGASPTKG